MLFRGLGLLCLLALAGCATPVFYKAGATQQDFVATKYSCERDSRQSGGFGTGIAGAINQQQFFNRCMEAQGWDLQNKDQQDGLNASMQSKKAEIKSLATQRDDCIKLARNNESKIALISSHLVPLKDPRFTILQKADTSLATPAEAAVLLRYLEKADGCRSEFVEAASKVFPNGAAHLRGTYASASRTWLQVIRRETSWGSAATQLEQDTETANAKAKTIQG